MRRSYDYDEGFVVGQAKSTPVTSVYHVCSALGLDLGTSCSETGAMLRDR